MVVGIPGWFVLDSFGLRRCCCSKCGFGVCWEFGFVWGWWFGAYWKLWFCVICVASGLFGLVMVVLWGLLPVCTIWCGWGIGGGGWRLVL